MVFMTPSKNYRCASKMKELCILRVPSAHLFSALLEKQLLGKETHVRIPCSKSLFCPYPLQIKSLKA